MDTYTFTPKFEGDRLWRRTNTHMNTDAPAINTMRSILSQENNSAGKVKSIAAKLKALGDFADNPKLKKSWAVQKFYYENAAKLHNELKRLAQDPKTAPEFSDKQTFRLISRPGPQGESALLYSKIANAATNGKPINDAALTPSSAEQAAGYAKFLSPEYQPAFEGEPPPGAKREDYSMVPERDRPSWAQSDEYKHFHRNPIYDEKIERYRSPQSGGSPNAQSWRSDPNDPRWSITNAYGQEVYTPGANYKDNPMYSTREIEREQAWQGRRFDAKEKMDGKKYTFRNQKERAQFIAEGGNVNSKAGFTGVHPFERITPAQYDALLAGQAAGDKAAIMELNQRMNQGQRYNTTHVVNLLTNPEYARQFRQKEDEQRKKDDEAFKTKISANFEQRLRSGEFNGQPLPQQSTGGQPARPVRGKVRGTASKPPRGGQTLPSPLDKLSALNAKKGSAPSITISHNRPGAVGSTTLTPDSVQSQMSYGAEGNMQVSAGPTTVFYKGKPIHQSPSTNAGAGATGPKPTFRTIGGRVVAMKPKNATSAGTEVRNGKLFADLGGRGMTMVAAPKSPIITKQPTKPTKGMR